MLIVIDFGRFGAAAWPAAGCVNEMPLGSLGGTHDGDVVATLSLLLFVAVVR